MKTTDSVRLTITMPAALHKRMRERSGSNVSGYLSSVLERHIEEDDRARLRNALIEGCRANAASDLEVAEEFRSAEEELARGIQWQGESA